LSDESINLITGYITKIHGVDRHALPTTIAQLLRLDEDAFYQLYLGRIVPIFVELAGQLEHLREEQSAFLNEELYSRLDESQNYESPFANSEIMEELNADKEVLAEIESAELADEEAGTDSLILSQEASLFLEALEAESNNPVNRKIITVGRKIVDLLETRLRILRTWTRIFARPRLAWTPSLEALIESCIQLLRERSELISLQEKHCQRITKILNDDELEITIFTGGVRGEVTEHQRDIQGLDRLTTLYQKLFSATPSLRLRDLQRASVACDDYLDRLRSILQVVEDVMDSNQQHEFLFIPVEIDLRQGGTYRNFTQLSFGQKSGIILNIVLLTTNEGIIIIDQPEDNLDANSIATLVPTLNRLGKKRQIILATHNSNLVLALNSRNVVVLESQGDVGKIKTFGSPLKSKNLVREMMDILEGGVDTFDLKIKVYDEFITRVRGEIQDIDIQLIENSFRRRTIDNLRNILQPIVSDKSILDFARHELKNILQPFLSDQSILDLARDELKQHGGIKVDPKETLKTLEDTKGVDGLERAKLIISLDKLSGQLDAHIKRLMRAISDISLMDTQPQPKDLELYPLLIELKEDYLERVSRRRSIQIEIDEQLKGCQVYADVDHLRLIFRNLFNNSFRATETKVIQNRRSGQTFTESIGIKLLSESNGRLTLLLMDNGCGIPSWIKEKLYFERCSDQGGGDHGLGGVIIRKLLDLNGGAIQVLSNYPSADQFVTTQQITLPESKYRGTFK
jgi:signal transduction histidine kinase